MKSQNPFFYSGIETCVVCGQPIEWTNDNKNHHCNPKTENRIEGSRQGSGNRDHNIAMSEAQRLSYGFHLLNINERE